MAIQFDPFEYMQQLEAAGVSRAEAEVHAKTLEHIVSSYVAYAHDLNLVRQEIKALEERMDLRFAALEERMNLRFEALELKLTGMIHALDAKFTGEIRQLRWMLGTVMATNIAIVLKLFLP